MDFILTHSHSGISRGCELEDYCWPASCIVLNLEGVLGGGSWVIDDDKTFSLLETREALFESLLRK